MNLPNPIYLDPLNFSYSDFIVVNNDEEEIHITFKNVKILQSHVRFVKNEYVNSLEFKGMLDYNINIYMQNEIKSLNIERSLFNPIIFNSPVIFDSHSFYFTEKIYDNSSNKYMIITLKNITSNQYKINKIEIKIEKQHLFQFGKKAFLETYNPNVQY